MVFLKNILKKEILITVIATKHKVTKRRFQSDRYSTNFSVEFGPQEWLTPYTDKTLEDLPSKGIKNLLVICPGFASDCVETLEEIDIQGRGVLLKTEEKNLILYHV